MQSYCSDKVAADYSRKEVWEHISPNEAARLEQTVSLLPAGTTRILDVGCGDGRFLHRVSSELERVGCDMSPGALELCQFPAIGAALPQLPFQNESFELVTCL